ncbi:MAG: sigma-70 family RNA polymerase sigma factor [Chloroflexaceae bacterium]|nr:sigma-70 family RNA polymerase sigma factor [Chloroflexaceae bacterium]
MPGPEIQVHLYDSEEEMLRALRHGDPDACTCLVKRFASLVYAQAMRLLTDPDEAESVLQLTFFKACDKIRAFDGRSGLGTWLYRIATNEALMELRRQRVVTTSLDAVEETLQASELPQNRGSWMVDPSQAALNSELRDYLHMALVALPESLRVVFVLREVQGLSTAETARRLGLKENAVKVRLHRARLRLRELLTGYLWPVTSDE